MRIPDESRTPSAEDQSVEVRGTTGTIRISEDGAQVLLTWTEGDLFYLVAGDLTAEDALRDCRISAIIKSLK